MDNDSPEREVHNLEQIYPLEKKQKTTTLHLLFQEFAIL